MPPCAAFECERTGWTFDMIATETPSSAAARAARWPASPAPITRTSCWGNVAAEELLLGAVELRARVDRDRLRVHDVRDPHAFEARRDRRLHVLGLRPAPDEEPEQHDPEPP